MYDMQPPQPVQMPTLQEKKRMSVPQIMLIVLALAFAAWYLITDTYAQDDEYFPGIIVNTDTDLNKILLNVEFGIQYYWLL